jgi:hypothetical protein
MYNSIMKPMSDLEPKLPTRVRPDGEININNWVFGCIVGSAVIDVVLKTHVISTLVEHAVAPAMDGRP